MQGVAPGYFIFLQFYDPIFFKCDLYFDDEI